MRSQADGAAKELDFVNIWECRFSHKPVSG
jgi:hypothetical protein